MALDNLSIPPLLPIPIYEPIKASTVNKNSAHRLHVQTFRRPIANTTHQDIRWTQFPLQLEAEHHKQLSHELGRPVPSLHLGKQTQEVNSPQSPNTLPESRDWKAGGLSPGLSSQPKHTVCVPPSSEGLVRPRETGI